MIHLSRALSVALALTMAVPALLAPPAVALASDADTSVSSLLKGPGRCC